ncbi:kinase-like domain-containing protein [Dunaliella salina]|uniref:non-specific serine/threonine protein kinase n=1 Tax=Dunaliella salina TaxID=3046 RepID=A0ABQ7GLM3_DUNSA|nr:kinase-like domain-containing protein [Dunaliella salina]|eukprot:KAF5835510.1 kinase-like domain-containing protein [Dunaliella salina]
MRPLSPSSKPSSPSTPHSPDEAYPGTSPPAPPQAASSQRMSLQQRGQQLLAWLVQPVVVAVQALLRMLRAAHAVLLHWWEWRRHSMQSRGQEGSSDGDMLGGVVENLQGHVHSRTEEHACVKGNEVELHANHGQSAQFSQDVMVIQEGEGVQNAVAKPAASEDSQKLRSSRQVQGKSSSTSSSSVGSSSNSSLSSSSSSGVSSSCNDGSGTEASQSSILVVSKLSRNLVQMLGCARDGESLTLLSEFSEGGDLQQLLKKEQDTRRGGKAQGKLQAAAGAGGVLLGTPQVHAGLDGLNEQQLLHIARDLLAGLAALQRGGLTHGDIKPSNCFVSYTEESPCDALELGPAPAAPSPLAMQIPATDKPTNLLGNTASRTAAAPSEIAAPVGPQPHSLALLESCSSAPSTLASTGTFSIDSSTEEEDIEAMVLQPPNVPLGSAGAVPVSELGSAPAYGLAAAKQPMSLLAFAPSSTNSGLLLPKKPKLRRRKSMVFKLGDYGTLREKGRQHLHYFVSGFGYTPEYAAPEALRYGTAKAHAPADIWAVGVTLLELLLGRLPTFAVKMRELQGPDDHKARQHWLSKNKPADLRDLHEAVVASQSAPPSPELQEVLSACLQLQPENRPQSAEKLLSYPWFLAPVSKAWLVE